MTGPAYPAARAVARQARDHFARHLLAARAQGQADLAPEPDCEAIESIADAAFWASLRREEGFVPKISLAFLPPHQAGLALKLERSLPLTSTALTKLAPAVERPGIHLGVWRRNGGPGGAGFSGQALARDNGFEVWGATRTIPEYCFVLEVVAPGLLVIKHRSGLGIGKFVNVAVLEGDQVKVLDSEVARFADSSPLVRALLGLDLPGDGREPVNALVQLAVSMRAHGRGGSLLVVPSKSELWRESIVKPISYGVAPPFEVLGRLMREDHGERQERRWEDALRRAVDAIAGLTAVDGATVLSDAYDVLAFGVKITRRDGCPRVERVAWAEPLEGSAPRIVIPAELGGTRHLSAAQFVADQRDSIAMVASQDGRFTVFGWSSREQMVQAYRVEALLL